MLIPLKDCNFLHLCTCFERVIFFRELVLNVPRSSEMNKSLLGKKLPENP